MELNKIVIDHGGHTWLAHNPIGLCARIPTSSNGEVTLHENSKRHRTGRGQLKTACAQTPSKHLWTKASSQIVASVSKEETDQTSRIYSVKN